MRVDMYKRSGAPFIQRTIKLREQNIAPAYITEKREHVRQLFTFFSIFYCADQRGYSRNMMNMTVSAKEATQERAMSQKGRLCCFRISAALPTVVRTTRATLKTPRISLAFTWGPSLRVPRVPLFREGILTGGTEMQSPRYPAM